MKPQETNSADKGATATAFPPQVQEHQPGIESEMVPLPESDAPQRLGSSKLENKVALITGGDSGIGRAVAIAFAREGADVAIVYLEEHGDASDTKQMVEAEGRECLLLSGDIGDEGFCKDCVTQTTRHFGRIDILVNNAGEQHPTDRFEEITADQLERTFRTNVFSYFYMAKAAIPHLPKGGVIINTSSVTAYRGSEHLVDYSATKAAEVGFTRSLALAMADKGIRVNAVAPGPIWTPLIPASFEAEHVATFGQDVPMKRAGQPEEVAPSYVFLASEDASYMTGQTLHPNGGEVING
jgi:NAD(P)-dependent dehydrogenase (short-subunit alcohol dehydrogenase family)